MMKLTAVNKLQESMNIQELTVILVEPSKTQFKIVKKQLAKFGIETIDHFETAESALNEIRKTPPDLVISALYLPDRTGTELLYAIRDDESLHETAYILISSETRFKYLDPIRQAGATAILPKPFTQDQLQAALESTIDFVDTPDQELADIDTDSLHVLVVDDSSMSRKHLHRILEGMGIVHIKEAENGIAGARLIDEMYFDLVISDYNMPEMDGQQFIDYIRNESGQPGIPVLMVTSESNENRLAAIQKSGVTAICDKPFGPSTIKHLIENVLSDIN